MKHYGLTWRQTMTTPVKAFWLMLGNLPRVMAETDLRTLDLLITAQSGDRHSIEDVRAVLAKEIGPMSKEPEPELDEAGLDGLRMLGSL